MRKISTKDAIFLLIMIALTIYGSILAIKGIIKEEYSATGNGNPPFDLKGKSAVVSNVVSLVAFLALIIVSFLFILDKNKRGR